MGSLAAAHLRRAGVADLALVNRTPAAAERLAAASREEGVPARAAALEDVGTVLADADVALVCTGAIGTVVGAATVAAARARTTAPLVVCDLGLPRDVEPDVGHLAGVTLVDLDTLGDRLHRAAAGQAVERTRELVAAEVRGYLAAQRTAEVTPTVTALRRRAAEVVDAEMLRLDGRLPDLEPALRGEVARTVHRVVEKLLHTPTVQVKRLAQSPGGDTYAEALRELFELDPQTPAAVTSGAATSAGVVPRTDPSAPTSVEGAAIDPALAVDPRPRDARSDDGPRS